MTICFLVKDNKIKDHNNIVPNNNSHNSNNSKDKIVHIVDNKLLLINLNSNNNLTHIPNNSLSLGEDLAQDNKFKT